MSAKTPEKGWTSPRAPEPTWFSRSAPGASQMQSAAKYGATGAMGSSLAGSGLGFRSGPGAPWDLRTGTFDNPATRMATAGYQTRENIKAAEAQMTQAAAMGDFATANQYADYIESELGGFRKSPAPRFSFGANVKPEPTVGFIRRTTTTNWSGESDTARARR
jgi:hypothetical protein